MTRLMTHSCLGAGLSCVLFLLGACGSNPDAAAGSQTQDLASPAPADTTPDLPPPGTPPPTSPGSGQIPGVSTAGGLVFYGGDALLEGFEWFAKLKGWFPDVIHTSHATNRNSGVVDMAYASTGTMTFKNVVVPTPGNYTLTIRYAYAQGLFHGILDRPMGVATNGNVITSNMHFPCTNSFSVYETSSIQIPLKAGTNVIQVFNVSDHGVSRVDTLTVK